MLEYKDSLASGIKEMWDNSIKHWNGETHSTTVERVINKENNSSHLHLTLAVLDEIVAGYCKLSLDHNDSNALYIDLLNVRDDFQGRKVGKKLVLDALEKTRHLGWERLHLNTWPGNIKAVPLYKKCGFFWEKRDDTTHLVNLMPIVLNCGLFKEYFSRVDWYKDSQRIISIEPDGDIENEFNIWKYSWKKNDDKLDIYFTRRGRGIKKIETKDYSIEAIVENLILPYGQSYKVKYKFSNKSNKPLKISLKGKHDKNISFDFSKSIEVIDSSIIEGEFFVEENMEEISPWTTHPSVITDCVINGKSVRLKTGIIPKAPLTIELTSIDKKEIMFLRGKGCDFYLNIKNHNREGVEYKFKLSGDNRIKFSQEVFKVFLEPNEKKSIPVKIDLLNSLYYTNRINVEAVTKSGKIFNFETEVSYAFNLGYDSFYGESKKYLKMGIGLNELTLSKENNRVSISNLLKKASVTILPGMIGYPFSSEFETKGLTSSSFELGEGWILLKVKYNSDSYSGLVLTRYFKLFSNGLCERWFDVESAIENLRNLYISDRILYEGVPTYFSYNNELVQLEDDNYYNLESWDSGNISENWIYSIIDDSNIGFIWSDKSRLQLEKGNLTFNTEIGDLVTGSHKSTGKETISFDTFQDWRMFRSYSINRVVSDNFSSRGIDFVINKNNPFLENSYWIEVNSLNKAKLKGDLEYSVGGHTQALPVSVGLNKELSIPPGNNLSQVGIKYSNNETVIRNNQVVFKKDVRAISLKRNKDIWELDNGVLKFKASDSFGPVIFSISYKGNEWLDTNYPDITSKSWWNPWCGGLMAFPDGLSLKSLQDEKVTMDFVEKRDNRGNIWSGISIKVEVVKDKDNLGFNYTQYYLTQGEAPVIMFYNEYNRRGQFSKETFIYNNFFKGCNDLTFNYINNQGRPSLAIGGSLGLMGESRGVLYLLNNKYRESLLFLSHIDDNKGYYLNRDITMVWHANSATAKDGFTGRTKPNFIVFSEESLEEDTLYNLKRLEVV